MSNPGPGGEGEWSRLQIWVAPPCAAFYVGSSGFPTFRRRLQEESLERDY
jgi:hypothetical protein